MTVAVQVLEDGIPGVFEARQSRSAKSRDSFVRAGIDALNSKRFDELKIADLAKDSDNSVGSFYARFRDKKAFFRALIAFTADGIDREFNVTFTAEKLQSLSPGEALDALVEFIGAIFSSRFRGVLRETYPRILEADDPWAPIRKSAKTTMKSLHEGLRDAFPHYSKEETETRLSFCFQIIVGVLQNDLVNNSHVYTLKDGSVLVGLKETLRAYMGVALCTSENPKRNNNVPAA